MKYGKSYRSNPISLDTNLIPNHLLLKNSSVYIKNPSVHIYSTLVCHGHTTTHNFCHELYARRIQYTCTSWTTNTQNLNHEPYARRTWYTWVPRTHNDTKFLTWTVCMLNIAQLCVADTQLHKLSVTNLFLPRTVCTSNIVFKYRVVQI